MKIEIIFAKDNSIPETEQKGICAGLVGALRYLTAEDVQSEIRKVECVHDTWDADPEHAEEACLLDKLFYFHCDNHVADVGILFDYGTSKEFLCYENVSAARFNVGGDVRVVAIP